MSIIGLRFFQFQIINHDQYAAYAENNSIREIRLPAPRGVILDRNGDYLVTNRAQYSLAVIPAEVNNTLEALEGLGRYLDLGPEEINQIVTDASGFYKRYQPVILYDDISFIQRSYIEEHRLEFPGIFFVDRSIRHYPSRARATHIIGYLRPIAEEEYESFRKDGYRMGDVVGAAGIEKALEQRLRGIDGYKYHLVDNLLRDLGSVPHKPTLYPVPGDSIILSIDIDLQATGEQLMEGRRGALILMDPDDGTIFTYVSAPDYVLAPFIGPISPSLWEYWREHPDKVLLNRPADGLYPPGSTFKLIAAAAALAGGVIDPDATILCEGVYPFGDRNFHCNVWPGHGDVDLTAALRVSCNIYFYKLIQQIGFKAWVEMAKKFGFGEATGFDIGQESTGLVPTPDYMDRKYADEGWTAGHLLNLVLGQGDLLVTPLQITRMTAAIANGGRLVHPTLIINANQRSTSSGSIDLPDHVWEHLQNSMYQVVNGHRGTGFRANIPGAQVFGKTGTAENPHGDGHSWFTGYMVTPTGKRVVITVLVELGGLGSRVAAPLAGQVLQAFLERYDATGDQELAEIQ
ncbi:MAG: penicillin-binding protein 2 [Candidatus Marinimicrobia bacterium]|nr:penicillin-binding protein 2 [Candidatus Neomarinimicrobiota bacterium]